MGGAEPAGSGGGEGQQSLAVPGPGGENPPRASNPWQCQKNAPASQQSLALPILGGAETANAGNPWQCQS